jgi:integrase
VRSRRGRGEGSVFRRGDGLWCGSVTSGYDAQGKRKRRVAYGVTKQEVLEKLGALRSDVVAWSTQGSERTTVSTYLDRWLEDAVRQTVRTSTHEFYRMIVRTHLSPQIGGLKITKLAPMHIQGVLANQERSGGSSRIRQATFDVLHSALKQAVKWDIISRNPCETVPRPRVARVVIQSLTPEQARQFLSVAATDRLYALYTVLIGCGLRLGEALGLTWPDVDLKRGTLTVRQQLCEVSGKLWLQEPKTDRARRTVDMPGFVIHALCQHQEQMRNEGHLVNDRLLVFVDTEGHPVRRSNLRRRSFLALLTRAGLPRIRLHDLRHTAATLHLVQGTHPSVVQHMLGHARVSITLDTYSHVLPRLSKEAATRMDALLGPAQGAEMVDPQGPGGDALL